MVERRRDRRYVVLGADGFIGSAVVGAALARGAAVTALCMRNPWRLAHIDNSSLVRVPVGTRLDQQFTDQVRTHVAGADAMIHLGYLAPPSGLDPQARINHERSVNAEATAVMAEAAADVPFVFASSVDVYGTWLDEPATEFTDPRPSTPYATAKLEAESSLGNYSTVMRISTVYGPGELVPRAIPSFIKACLTGGPATLHGGGLDVKDYVPLRAVGEAFVAAAETTEATKRTFNISSGKSRSTAAVLESVIEAVGQAPVVENVPNPRSPSKVVVSPLRAQTELGFDPGADFRADLQAEAAWLDANRDLWQ